MAERDDPLLQGPVAAAAGRGDQRPGPDLAGRPDDDRHGAGRSHGRAIQVRQRHSPGWGRQPSSPRRAGGARTRSAPQFRVRSCHSRRVSAGWKSSARKRWTKKKRRKMPWLTASTRSSRVLEQLRLDPLDAGEHVGERLARRAARSRDRRRGRPSTPTSGAALLARLELAVAVGFAQLAQVLARSRSRARARRRSARLSAELGAAGSTTGASARGRRGCGRRARPARARVGEPVAFGVGQVAAEAALETDSPWRRKWTITGWPGPTGRSRRPGSR